MVQVSHLMEADSYTSVVSATLATNQAKCRYLMAISPWPWLWYVFMTPLLGKNEPADVAAL